MDPRELRDALGQFATGVTVITARQADGEVVGMTASSFNSLSLEPALVLWSIGKNSSNYLQFVDAEAFNIHILSDQQQALAGQFARKDIDRFEGVELCDSSNPAPAIANCLARFECRNEAQHDGGDHTILVGKVEKMDVQAGRPLIFQAGQFQQLQG